MVKLDKPAWVLIDTDVLEYLPEDVRQSATVCTLIDEICPKCGFIISQELNQKQWEAFLKRLK